MPARKRPPAAALVVIVPLAVALAVAAFAWPAARLEPRDLPVGVVGAAPAIERQPGAFEVHRYAGVDAARAAIRDRDVYGAIVAGPGRPTVLTASAGSAIVAQLLPQEVARGGVPPRVVDVVPAPADDPRGAGLSATVLPIVLAAMLVALLARAVAPPGARRIAALVAGAALAALTVVVIAQSWLGVLEGGWLANAAVIGLMVVAIAAPILALEGALGIAGVGLGAGLMVLIGNPWSGMSSAPELLPSPAGTIGALLPPGAGGSLLRSSAFFDGAGAAGALWVLGAWALAGVAAGLVLARRQPPSSPVR
jgi:hypothetical protein